MFTPEELKNIAILIQKSTISGNEAPLVAVLLQKIQKLLEVNEKKDEQAK